jgi:major membrane immunogen (membrane-anchored lipoprotein)
LPSHGRQRKRHACGNEPQQEARGSFAYGAEQLVEDQAEDQVIDVAGRTHDNRKFKEGSAVLDFGKHRCRVARH